MINKTFCFAEILQPRKTIQKLLGDTIGLEPILPHDKNGIF